MDRPITDLYTVGPRRAALLAKLGIHTAGDLLRHYPRGYLDLSSPYTVSGAPLGQVCPVLARVWSKSGETRVRGGKKLYKVVAGDDSGELDITFFNNPYASANLKIDGAYLFYGKVEAGRGKARAMASPVAYPAGTALPFAAHYRLTSGISDRILAALVRQALGLSLPVPEPIPPEVREQYRLMDAADAVRAVHFPASLEELSQARRRLTFEELFVLACGVGILRTHIRKREARAMENHPMDAFYQALPFSPTAAQKRAVDDLIRDLCSGTPANRLIQGDVGSGKTVVAAAGAYFAWLSGAQSAIMAPTELLARQHFLGLSPLLGGLGMRLALLTGSTGAAEKKKIRAALESGEIDLCIGTHALLSDPVAFHDLGLVVTDEQHRFGVTQRAALAQKGRNAHVLVMSATPIPRTLALMIYGELDLSVIDELPPGRKPINTYKISSGKRERAFRFIHQHLEKGYQAYIVCPLVEQEEDSPPGLHAAVDYVQEIRSGIFSDCKVGLLHGKMPAKEKEAVMSAFQSGEIQLLVSTTVIEVGVDVPNAVIMAIENAERFGLSQLHQLRGRVGRGSGESTCILLSDSRSPDTAARLMKLCETNDGFAIAEYDLQTRGPGNFLGQEQHGLPQLRMADLSTDTDLVGQAREAAESVLAQDPALERHGTLRRMAQQLMDSVGGRLN